MSSSLFSTQIINGGANKIALGGQALGGGASALLGGNGLGAIDFWSIILGTGEEGKMKQAANSLLNGQNNTTGETKNKPSNADMALLQLALLGQDPDKSFEEKLGDLKIERLAQTKENRIAQLTKLVEHLTSGLPQDISNGSIETLVGRLEKRLEKLEASLEAFRNGTYDQGDEPFKALIATGLNPSQLTNITNRIQEVEEKLGRELTVEDLIAGVGNIIPAPGDDDHEFATTDALAILTRASREQQNEIGNQENDGVKNNKNTTESDDQNDVVFAPNGIPLSDNQKAIDTGNKNKHSIGETTQKVASITDIIDQINAARIPAAGTRTAALESTPPQDGVDTATGLVEGEASELLSNAEYKALFGAGKKVMPSTAKMNMFQAQTIVANTPAAQNVQNPLQFNFTDTTADQALLSDTLGYDVTTGTPFSNAIQAAHMATNVSQAGQAHSATSMVAAQMTKAANSGQPNQITLHLDPPELGRVEIRMEFLDDAKVKANLIVEKPETLLMLQRDAQALEKALQNAGLDADGNSLSFEMADDEHAFNSNKDGQGNQGEAYGANNGGNGEEDDLLIHTNMTWDVDPETGHVHYSILA